MKQIRFLMIGGFLGAGKTTSIARLAKHYTQRQLNVGLVTNDQAYDLVDTQSLKAQGFQVGEVPGACFCCKFDDLVDTMQQLSSEQEPDVIIAEPVGSCTDLMATVIEPLRHLYGDRFEVGPLAVLLKPEHGFKILSDDPRGGFSPQAAYIFLKQIEESNIVVINKIDKLSEERRSSLEKLVLAKYPAKQVVMVSARDGVQFDRLIEVLETNEYAPQATLDIDYDIYAEGEAELGWFNGQIEAIADSAPISLDEMVLRLAQKLKVDLQSREVEVAHLKIMGQIDSDFAVANLVATEAEVELSLASNIKFSKANLIVNARVADDPDKLTDSVRAAVAAVSAEVDVALRLTHIQSFRPGRPTPTHRITH